MFHLSLTNDSSDEPRCRITNKSAYDLRQEELIMIMTYDQEDIYVSNLGISKPATCPLTEKLGSRILLSLWD